MRDHEITSEEIKEYVALEPAFNCYGQEKSLKLLEMQKKAKMEEFKNLVYEYNNLMASAGNNQLDSKTLACMYNGKGGADPMVMGGIANAIAGPGAGVYAALKTQYENATVQAANREFSYLAAKVKIEWEYMVKEKLNTIKEIEQQELPAIEKEINRARQTKITDIEEKDITDMIHIKKTKTYSNVNTWSMGKIDEFCGIEATIEYDKSYFKKKYGSARIDGSFFSHFYTATGYYLGSIKMVLPLFGIYESETIRSGCFAPSFLAEWKEVDKNEFIDEGDYEWEKTKHISCGDIYIVPNKLWVVDMN